MNEDNKGDGLRKGMYKKINEELKMNKTLRGSLK